MELGEFFYGKLINSVEGATVDLINTVVSVLNKNSNQAEQNEYYENLCQVLGFELLPKEAYDTVCSKFNELFAEKMQTILARGLANTRMRDFYDVYEIMNSKADQISFDVLKKAFAATCMKRETSFGEEEVRETLDKIKDDSGLEEMWNRFKRANYFVDDLSWGEVSETIVDNIEKISFFSDQVS